MDTMRVYCTYDGQLSLVGNVHLKLFIITVLYKTEHLFRLLSSGGSGNLLAPFSLSSSVMFWVVALKIKCLGCLAHSFRLKEMGTNWDSKLF
jgi:hypothetical protein